MISSEFLHMNLGDGVENGGNGGYILINIYNRTHDVSYHLNREIIKVSPNK